MMTGSTRPPLDPTTAQLSERIDELVAKVDRLERENDALRDAGRVPTERLDLSDARMSRRRLLARSGGAIAAGAVLVTGQGLFASTPARAGYEDGIAVSGQSRNDIGVYGESLSSSHASVLGRKRLRDGEFHTYGPAIQGLITDAANTSPAVYGDTDGGGPGVFGINRDTGNGNGLSGVAEGTGSGVYAKSTRGNAVLGVINNVNNNQAAIYGNTDGGGPGVFGEGFGQGNGTSGVANGGGSGLYGKSESGQGVLGTSRLGRGVVGSITNANNTNVAVYGRTDGNGTGVFGECFANGNGTIGLARGSGAGVYGRSATGSGVVAEITNLGNSRGAVHGLTQGSGPGVFGESRAQGNGLSGVANGTGSGVYAESQQGRGGLFVGAKAQVRLKPSAAATHPTSGEPGDLFVDKSKRLWFCKGGTAWKQLA